MQRSRLIDARDEVAEAAGINATVTGAKTNPALVRLVNIVGRRLAIRGRWLGTTQRYKINAQSALITWPRQVTTVEAIAVCNCPGEIRNGWYEFLGHGPGLVDCDTCFWHTLVDRGTAPVFADITPGKTDQKLYVISTAAESPDSVLTVQGYDEKGQWIRTHVQDEGWIDGERIPIATVPVYSNRFFRVVSAIIKPVTQGSVSLFEYQTSGTPGEVKQLGYYEPDETTPIYRRSVLPGVMEAGHEDACGRIPVTVVVKLRYIPVVNDNDWLMISNLDALTLGVLAVLKERKDLAEEAELYWAKATRELETELREYNGDGAISQPNFAPDFGASGIPAIN